MWSISPAFRAAVQSPVHSISVKAQVLDTDLRVVAGGEFYGTGDETHIQPYIVDGQVDADAARNTRRTMNLSLMNPDAEFTPNSDWGGLFYVDRLIRIWRGVVFADGNVEYVPVGTFMIDTADVVAERNMSIVAITGSDLWKMLAKGKLGAPLKYESGTPVQDIIKDLAERGGVDRFVFDSLSHRTTQTREIQADLNLERAVILGDEIRKLGTAWGLDIYFDAMGRMVSEENRLSRPTSWTFEPGQDSGLLAVKASYKDEGLYNHILVTGTADEANPVYGNAFDNDPTSPTNVERIGRRTYMYESKYIATAEQAVDVAKDFLRKHTQVSEDIEVQNVCMPAFECGDGVAIREPEFTKLNQRRRIQSFNVPLSSSRQTIRLHRMVTV